MTRAVRRYDEVVDEPSLSLRVAAVSLDCGDHGELARFYAGLLAGTLLWAHEKSAAVESDGVVLVMQRVEDYQPPAWPGTSIVHLDLSGGAPVSELEQRAVALGARLAETQPDPRWRVLLDPAGHPFCITPFTP
jgi:Glyoxalase-like domain